MRFWGTIYTIWLAVRQSLVMILSNIKKIFLVSKQNDWDTKGEVKLQWNLTFLKNTFHTGCGAMFLNYSAKNDLKILYTAKSSFNYWRYIYIYFFSHVQKLHRPLLKKLFLCQRREKWINDERTGVLSWTHILKGKWWTQMCELYSTRLETKLLFIDD